MTAYPCHMGRNMRQKASFGHLIRRREANGMPAIATGMGVPDGGPHVEGSASAGPAASPVVRTGQYRYQDEHRDGLRGGYRDEQPGQ